MTHYKIALVGNPNVGKTSVFNKLTNLRQKVGNYPGVTVEKRVGNIERNGNKFQITDMPGTYTMYPSSLDEEIVFKILGDKTNANHPDLAVVVGEPLNLKRSILLYQQVRDLGVPAIFVSNMMDEIDSKGLHIDIKKLEAFLQPNIYLTNARTSKGLDELIDALTQPAQAYKPMLEIPSEFSNPIQQVKEKFNVESDYLAWHYLSQKEIPFISQEEQQKLDALKKELNLIPRRLQVKETLDRNKFLEERLDSIITYDDETGEEEISTLEISADLREIKSIIFDETVYLDPKTLVLTKEINTIAPVRWYYGEEDWDRKNLIKEVIFYIKQ